MKRRNRSMMRFRFNRHRRDTVHHIKHHGACICAYATAPTSDTSKTTTTRTKLRARRETESCTHYISEMLERRPWTRGRRACGVAVHCYWRYLGLSFGSSVHSYVKLICLSSGRAREQNVGGGSKGRSKSKRETSDEQTGWLKRHVQTQPEAKSHVASSSSQIQRLWRGSAAVARIVIYLCYGV